MRLCGSNRGDSRSGKPPDQMRSHCHAREAGILQSMVAFTPSYSSQRCDPSRSSEWTDCLPCSFETTMWSITFGWTA